MQLSRFIEVKIKPLALDALHILPLNESDNKKFRFVHNGSHDSFSELYEQIRSQTPRLLSIAEDLDNFLARYLPYQAAGLVLPPHFVPLFLRIEERQTLDGLLTESHVRWDLCEFVNDVLQVRDTALAWLLCEPLTVFVTYR
jgi:hypothetical protein